FVESEKAQALANQLLLAFGQRWVNIAHETHYKLRFFLRPHLYANGQSLLVRFCGVMLRFLRNGVLRGKTEGKQCNCKNNLSHGTSPLFDFRVLWKRIN